MPYAGLDTNSAPGLSPEGKGPLVRNFLPQYKDKLVMRGPINDKHLNESPMVHDPPWFDDTMIPVGAWHHNDKLMMSFHRQPSVTGMLYRPPWKAPYLRSISSSSLAQPNAAMVWVNTTTGQVESVIVNEEVDLHKVISGVGARILDYTYGYPYYGIGAKLDNERYQWIRPLLRWDGDAGEPTAYDNAPQSGQYVKSHLNRLWVLGGIDPTLEEEKETLTGNTSNGVSYITSPVPWTGKGENAEWKIGQEIKGTGIQAGTVITSFGLDPKGNRRVYISKPATATNTGVVFKTILTDAKFEMNTLFFSDQGGPVNDSMDFWKDNISGLVNRIVVGDEDRNDFGVALAVVNQSLIIFKRKSVWALYGYSPSTFQVRNLTFEFGCVDPWSVCETHYGVYFMSQNGLMYFNGETFTQVDSDIDNITRPLVAECAGEAVDQQDLWRFGRVSCSDIGGGYLMLSIHKQNNTDTNFGQLESPSFTGIMHMDTQNWTEFTSNNLQGTGIPLLIGMINRTPYIFDGEYITQIPDVVTVNEEANVDSAHFPSTAIPAKIRTDRIPLSSPGYMSQFNRIMQDYTWPNGASDGAAQKGWWITVKDANGADVLPATQVEGHAKPTGRGVIDGSTPSAFVNGRRFEVDAFNEATDAVLEIEWKDNNLEVVNPELYDATFEIQMTRKRRTI